MVQRFATENRKRANAGKSLIEVAKIIISDWNVEMLVAFVEFSNNQNVMWLMTHVIQDIFHQLK